MFFEQCGQFVNTAESPVDPAGDVLELFLALGDREKIISPEFQELSVHDRILGW